VNKTGCKLQAERFKLTSRSAARCPVLLLVAPTDSLLSLLVQRK